MLQAFIIVLREGFEAFLIVAITYSYLKKTGRAQLLPAVWWGIAASVVVSVVLAFFLMQTGNEPLWEGIFALAAAVLVGWLVVHMWKTAPYLKQEMENHLAQAASRPTAAGAGWGVFLFTVLMISREGMETALLLLQIHEPNIVMGCALGAAAAALLSFAWVRLGRLIDLKKFFQVTAVFLGLFLIQVLMYAFHEFTETGLLPNSEALHLATEPFSPEGLYGKWMGMGMVAVCTGWLVWAWAQDAFARRNRSA